MSPERHPSVQLEEDRISRRLVYGALLCVLVVSAAFVLWAWLLYGGSLRELRSGVVISPLPPLEEREVISGVRQTLIRAEGEGLQRKRAAAEALSRWRWIDREAGIVQMPIEEAMRQMAREAGEGGP